MKAVEKAALILVLWLGLSAIWFAGTAWSQSADLEEAQRLDAQAEQLYRQGRYAEAVQLIQRALNIRERVLGPVHPEVATSLNNIALLYYNMGKYAEAEPLYKRSLAIAEKALGPEHPDVATSLNDFALLYQDMGNYAAAEPLYKRSLAILEKALGPEHPNLVASLNNLAMIYKATGNYAAAEPLYKRGLAIQEKALGSEHLDVALILNNLAIIYEATGNYTAAEPFYKRSLSIREKALSPEHPYVAESLNNLAKLYGVLGNYPAAEPLFKRSLAILEKAIGSEHPEVATSLNNLAALYYEMGNYTAAEPLFKRSLAIREKSLGPERPEVAVVLNNIAELYLRMGNYAAAEPLYKRSLEIREKALGSQHPAVATCLNNLANLYRHMGNWAAAEPLYKRCLDIDEKTLNSEHPDVATTLYNLAEFYHDMGNYAAAEPLYKRSLEIREKALGSQHPAVATSLNSIAALYMRMGNYAAAELLYKRSLTIWEKTYGPEHPAVAVGLNNLAELYKDMEKYADAELLYKRSLEIDGKILGPEHHEVTSTLNNIAALYSAMGNKAAAEPFYKRSLTIREKSLGSEHPDVAQSLSNISALRAASGDNQQSFELMIRAQRIQQGMIERVAGFTSGEQTMQYLGKIQTGVEFCLNLVSFRMKQDSAARKEAFGVWLWRKGVVLEAQRRMQQALIEAGDREAADVFEELSQTRTQLAELTFAGPGKDKPETYQKRLKELNAQKEELEAKLSRLSQAYAQARKVRKVTFEDVAKALPTGAVLVDFARIDVFNFEAKGNEKKWLPAHYLAFVLRPGQGQDVALLDIGAADEIDAALNQFKNALTQKQEAKARDLSRKLHDLIFTPVQKELGGAQRVFLSPDGALNLLPFEILKDPEGKYLIEKYTFNYLAAGRDLVGFGEKKASAEKPLLFGDPDFDLDPNRKSQALDRLGMRLEPAVASVRSAEQRGFRFDRLPNTRKEVSAIGDLMGKGQCEVFLDSSALEEVLQARRAPRILHLATHGFFLKDQQLLETRGIGGMVSFTGMDQGFARPPGPRVNLENPLLRSGIALAGANRAGSSGQGSDGILTADEVLGLRLRGTELVVLSACETGLGEVKTGEGVFGLRRAFAQAGARSMVMSMWSVPDRETQELMVEFYKNILSGKLDRCQALRQAALTQKKIVQQRYGQDNPFFWGAFVFLGQAD